LFLCPFGVLWNWVRIFLIMLYLVSKYQQELQIRKSVKYNSVSVYEFCFSCETNRYTKQLASISLYVTEFIGLQCRNMFRLMEPSSDDKLTNLMLLNYASCMNPYIVLITACYNKLKDIVCFFPLVNHIYMHRLSGCVFRLLWNVLNRYSKLTKSLKILKDIYIY
jgi:hypothetical protein